MVVIVAVKAKVARRALSPGVHDGYGAGGVDDGIEAVPRDEFALEAQRRCRHAAAGGVLAPRDRARERMDVVSPSQPQILLRSGKYII